jgi:hypothetical protein
VSPEAIEAWTRLYAAVGLLAGICAFCAAIKTLHDIRTGTLVLPAGSCLRRLLGVPRVWLHFQLAYLRGFPSILAVALLYAHYIGFDAFDPW